MEELHYKRIFYYIFIILNVLCLIFSHVTSATTNSGSVLEESQTQTTTPIISSLSTIPSYYTSATSKDFQIAPTSYMVLRQSYLPQVSSDALPQSLEESEFRPTISDIASLNTNLNDRGSQSFSVDSESSESRAFSLETSDGLSEILAKQSFASSDIVQISQVSDPMPSVMDMISTNIVTTASVMDVMSSNIIPTLPVIDVMSTMVDLMPSDILPTSTLIDLMSSDMMITQTNDIEPIQSKAESMQSDLASTQSQTGSTLNTNSLSPSILQFSSTIENSDVVPDSVTTSEFETISIEQPIFETSTEISVTDLSSELVVSADTSSAFVSDFNSALISSETDSVVSTSDLSYIESSIHTNSYSYVSTELLESQTGDLIQSGITAIPTTVSSEILFPVSIHGPGEILSSQATHFVSYSSLVIESSTSIETPESTFTVISPSSILAASSMSSSILNETMPVPEKNTSGLTSGGKIALGICIPIIIVLIIAAIVFYAYRRRYHTATWKLTDVVSYRPWSYSNATYYDDESTLIVSGLDK